jgi:hypothetical protein
VCFSHASPADYTRAEFERAGDIVTWRIASPSAFASSTIVDPKAIPFRIVIKKRGNQVAALGTLGTTETTEEVIAANGAAAVGLSTIASRARFD